MTIASPREGPRMSREPCRTRREILAAMGIAAAGAGARSGGLGPSRVLGSGAGADAGDEFVLKSQRLPEPKVALPTDALPPAQGPRKRLAAITTAYFRYSHADDIITKFIEGYAVVGRTHRPHCEVVSLSIEQRPASDIGRGMAARYAIPLFDTAAQALTLEGERLAVDGVLLIGEHGDYPSNEKGQQ